MKLIGIAIKIDDRKKFIGKVGIAPDRYGVPPPIVGHKIFYREAPFKHAYSYTTKTIGIDAAATDMAEKHGASYVVTYCADKKIIYVAAMTDLQKAYSLDLGEFPQYRLALNRWAKFKASGGIGMGYTRNVTTIAATNKPPLCGNELLNHAKQLSFFD